MLFDVGQRFLRDSVQSRAHIAHGLELIRIGGYAVVVLDLRLPDIDGIDVLRSTLEERPDQQVIVLSALPDVDTKVRCLDLGAADYITKPFSLTELLARVRRRHRQRASDGERFVRAGRLVLDLRNRAVDIGEGTVKLASREFLLLHHLVRHEQQLTTIVLPIQGEQGAAASARNQTAALPHAGDSIRANAAKTLADTLHMPHLARRHAGDEAIAVARVELPVAIRRES